MVRAHVKPPPEEKKESGHKKKPHSKTGLWACKINDCNKVFAREADLKRHQRTTKGHSQPGYVHSACPQCDATFTRTDALRRHQKSRHNGVIVESSTSGKTSEDESEDTDASMSSLSRESTPMKDDEAEAKPKTKPKNVSPKPQATSSRASYYRSQAAHPTYGSPLPPPPPIFIEGGYPHGIAIPTSAARLQWSGWPAPPPWAGEGSPVPPPPPQLYSVQPYYQPSHYYPHGPPFVSQRGAPSTQSGSSHAQTTHVSGTRSHTPEESLDGASGSDEDGELDEEDNEDNEDSDLDEREDDEGGHSDSEEDNSAHTGPSGGVVTGESSFVPHEPRDTHITAAARRTASSADGSSDAASGLGNVLGISTADTSDMVEPSQLSAATSMLEINASLQRLYRRPSGQLDGSPPWSPKPTDMLTQESTTSLWA
ncbi:hypothetical protein BDW22DRAFT_69322 [Trametopsis cervina]|nr:hypothetical protein BDW22DRAFT_69322 [Trametopsis cervina]